MPNNNKNQQQKSFRGISKKQKQAVKQIVQTAAPKQQRRKKGGGIMSAIGAAASTMLPGVAKYVGSAIASVLGRGDYVVSGTGITQNSLLNGNTPPSFANMKSDRATVVAHREFIKDVTTGPTLTNGATDFSYSTFSLNPGVNEAFPWLSNVARNFEEYELLGVLFEYKSTSSNALSSLNTALGTVVMSTQYNSANPPFGSKLQQENYEFAQSIKPAESALHAVECARGQNVLNRLYVRAGPIPADTDQRLYDLGEFQLSTVGMQAANVVIGELWVTYHVALYKPRFPSTMTMPVLSAKFSAPSGSATYPMGTATLSPAAGSTLLGGSIVTNTTSNIVTCYFPPTVDSGNFLIMYTVTNGTDPTYRPPAMTAPVNCTINLNPWTTGTGFFQVSFAFITVLAPGASFRLTGAVGSMTTPVMYWTQWAYGAPTAKPRQEEIDLVKRYAQKLARMIGKPVDSSKFFEEHALGEEIDIEEEKGDDGPSHSPRRKATSESMEILDSLPVDDLRDVTELLKRPGFVQEIKLLLQGAGSH